MSGESCKRRQVSTTPKTLGASGNNRRKVEPHCSNPPIIRRRALVGIVAGVDHPAWLDQHQLHLLGGGRLVLDALGHDIQLARIEFDETVAKIDAQTAFEHDEGFVGVGVAVPEKLPFQPRQLELVVVHLRDDFWLPLLGEQAVFLGEVDRGVLGVGRGHEGGSDGV